MDDVPGRMFAIIRALPLPTCLYGYLNGILLCQIQAFSNLTEAARTEEFVLAVDCQCLVAWLLFIADEVLPAGCVDTLDIFEAWLHKGMPHYCRQTWFQPFSGIQTISPTCL